MRKKVIPIIVVGVLFLSGLGNVVTSSFSKSGTLQNLVGNETMIIIESFPNADAYRIVSSENGQKIEVDGFNYLMEPGKPMLPFKKYLIALPPGAKVRSVEITGLNINKIPGKYNIHPAPVIMPLVDPGFSTDFTKMMNEEWKNNYELTYASDNPFPCKPGKLVCKGTLHDYVYVSIVLSPFKYYPLSGRLYKYDSVEIKITYNTQKSGEINYNPQITKKASELFDNYDEIKGLYRPIDTSSSSNSETIDYVIITTTNLYQSIISSYFTDWKSYLGHYPKIVNITDELIIEQSGHDLAEQIRTFLREYYQEWGIKYVLIVGNYDTVPMRYCYPNRNNHEFNLSDVFGGEFPTDSYYADLSYSDSESWDSDGDGFYGEYRDDNPDFLAEVSVGRIPTNDADRVVYTLEKIIAFEQDTGEWKNNVLHAGAIILFNPFDDGAVAMDNIEKDLMNEMTISHYCEKEGLKVSEYSWNPLTEETFTNDWRTGKYGIVNWAAHGWSNVALRNLWLNDDDGDGRADEDELEWKNVVNVDSDLDDDYPSIIFTISCMIGYPESSPNDWPDNRKGNLGVDILTKPSFGASVSIMCGTRITFLSPEYVTDHICYRFNQNLLIDHESVGGAFYNAKFSYLQNSNSPGTWKFTNMFSYNLYGDPSLVYEGIIVEGRPEKPVVSGPVSGKVGEEYTYSAVSVDPDNDNLYFFFDWGDGSYSDWLGPYESGMECSASYVWSERGKYEIKVRVKDTNGMISEWSDPLLVSMPKIYENPFWALIEKLFDWLEQVFGRELLPRIYNWE